jgi:uncharacterized repeat protein (TIGR01451 family)
MRFEIRRSMQSGVKILRRAIPAGTIGSLTLALGLAAAPVAAQAPDSLIINRADASYRAPDGSIGSTAAEVAVRFSQAAGVRLAPSQSAVLNPGESRVFTHRLENLGTALDLFRLETIAVAGWAIQLFMDSNGDGLFGPEDEPVTDAVSLDRGAGITLFLRVTAPAEAADGLQATVDLSAISQRDPTVTAIVRNEIEIRRLTAAPTIGKLVDRSGATAGDTLSYVISYGNDGDAPAFDVVISDALPAQVRYVPGSMALDGVSLSDDADGDAGSLVVAAGAEQLVFRLGEVAPRGSGELRFRAVVRGGASGVVANVASLTAEGFQLVSPQAITRLDVAEVTLEKRLLGRASIMVGDEASYRISWSTGDVGLRQAVLTDTLPSGLRFVTADGPVQVNGQVLVWSLGDIEANRSGFFMLTTRAVQPAASLVNHASIRGLNAADASASAAALEIRVDTTSAPAGLLEISKRAGVAEARVGDVLPYRIELRNAGNATITGILVHDILPAGVQMLGEVSGADSVRVSGRNVSIWVSGSIAAGETHILDYRVSLLAPGRQTALTNRAYAEANGGLRSDTAAAVVRMRQGFAGESRTVVGKVWLDTNQNGRQDPGEPGIPGAQVWSADGEMVMTDINGRYSFRNLRPGTHALRLDTLAIGAGRGLARSDDMIALVRVNGWTTPQADFRIVPRPTATAALITSSSALSETGSAAATAGTANPVAVSDTAVAIVELLAAVRVSPLRSELERDEDAARALLEGGRVRMLQPSDGSLSTSNRVSVVVQGDPGAAVKLYNGSQEIAGGTLRPDGRMDFVGVELERGPQSLRIWMRNGWGNEVWDSVRIHRSGAPHAFEVIDEPAALRADTRSRTPVELRLVDSWGVALPGTLVSVEASGARVEAQDADRSSVGMQIATDRDGVVRIPLHAGEKIGPGELRVAAADVRTRVPLRVLPATRELIATGAVQLGVGAAPEAFGAVTIRGALDEETSVSLSYDSRRRGEEYDFFGRGYDPLEEGRYPTFGDASERRVYASATQVLSARVERGYDWLELGDVDTGSFGGEGRLASHRRAVTGLAGRLTTGDVVWQAYGSLTDQALTVMQIRADGTSGPYRFGGSIRPGSERITVELRAAANAYEVLSVQELRRFADYQIDYATGTVFLFRPLPTSDALGNHLFLVGSIERRTGDEARLVGGARADWNAGSMLGLAGSDSLGVFLLGVHDAGAPGAGQIGNDRLGGGFRFRSHGFHGGAELLRGESLDSVAHASRAVLGWSSEGDRARLVADWTRIGAGFDPGVDPRLAGGLSDLRLSAEFAATEYARVRLTHSRQSFDAFGVERNTTSLHTQNRLFGRQVAAEGGLTTNLSAPGVQGSLLNGKLTVPVSDRLATWIEGSNGIGGTMGLPGSSSDQVGVGVGYRVKGATQVEMVQRWIGIGADSLSAASVTSMKVRTLDPFGGQLWGGVDHGFAAGGTAGVLGWRPTARLAGGWSAHGMLERRFGIDRMPLTDPSRGLPFAQVERDRWSAGAGAQWSPTDSIGRLSVRAEMHRGEISSGHRTELTGDAPLGISAAMLARVESWNEQRELGGVSQQSTRQRALMGLAFRPAESNALNMLGRLEWRLNNDEGQISRFGRIGEDRRFIGAADAIWNPSTRLEIAGRYATRWALGGDAFGTGNEIESISHFAGGRFDVAGTDRLRARLDGRLLLTAEGQSRSSIAPALVASPGGRIELEAGYRFGDLSDADFGTQSGSGLYATMAVRFSEGSVTRVADFWRDRMAAQP